MAPKIKITRPDFTAIFWLCSQCFRHSKIYFVFINKKLKQNIVKAFIRFVNDIKSKKITSIILLVVFDLIFICFGLSPALLWLLFLAFLFYGWDNRIIAGLALLCLAICPLLLHLKKDSLAEALAIYAYFFLVMTVVLQLIVYIKEQRAKKIILPALDKYWFKIWNFLKK